MDSLIKPFQKSTTWSNAAPHYSNKVNLPYSNNINCKSFIPTSATRENPCSKFCTAKCSKITSFTLQHTAVLQIVALSLSLLADEWHKEKFARQNLGHPRHPGGIHLGGAHSWKNNNKNVNALPWNRLCRHSSLNLIQVTE